MKLRILGLALIGAIGLAACGDDNNDITSRLRVVHLSPDASAIDVFVGDTREFTNVTFAVPTSYQDVGSGTRTMRFTPTGDNTTLGTTTSESLQSGQSYTLLATGFAESVSPLLLSDTSTAPASGKVRVRLVHASPSTGAVDVYVGSPTDDLSALNPTLSNVSFGSVTNYLSLDEGTYRIRLTAVGGSEPLIDQSATLSSGAVRTIIARDALGGGLPVEVVVLDDRS